MNKPSVVVLDDDEDNLVILEDALAARGFEVRGTHSCAEARAQLARREADALVTDLRLGDGTAFELVSALGPKRPRVVVLVTGFGGEDDREASAAAGFSAHLVKPITFDQLERALRTALARATSPASPTMLTQST
ncbi:MAG: response regulator [Polyangiaceae bacterium]|nr:response regulator [Polyangiaceae bacterium]